ncbi:MAG: hypothetical protein L6R19_25955 [Alphaproteobacteria bacterium]|nr:hypothetical protein [Alphaproteobacteria bacterium]
MVGTDLVITDLVGGRDGTDTIIAIGGAAANVNHLATFAGVPFIIAAIGASPGIQAPIFSSILGVGNTGDDTILASSSSNSLLNLIDGGSGNDLLGGGRQTDYLFGGNGDDTFIYYGGGQFVAGETVDGGAGSDTLLFSAANDDFSTGAVRSIEAIAFDGLGGTASFAGSQVGAGLLAANSSVTGGASTDTLTFNAAAGTSLDLSGFSFASWTNGTDSFQINGSTGAETLTGTGQNDTVTGGAGNDTMDGSAGADTFRYTSTGDGFDSILGFDGDGADQDVLDLDKLFDALGIATAARAARVQITDTSGGSDGPVWLIEVDTDGNGDFDLDVATIASTDAITVNQDVLTGSL